MTETFLSCFPLEESFALLKNEYGVDDIKFGKPGSSQQYLAGYTRHQFVLRHTFYVQVGQEVLKQEVLNWINGKIQDAKPRDVVNIIFESHGQRNGAGVILGKHRLFPPEVTALLRQFKDGVQVNMISGACFSGGFVDAIRADNQSHRYIASATTSSEAAHATTRSISNRTCNSRFSQAFVASFARIQLPGVQQQPVIRVEDHEAFMTNQLKRNITPGSQPDTHQSYYSAPITLQTAVEDMVFRDKIDVAYNVTVTSRRRRIEWPSLNPALTTIFQQPTTSNVPAQIKAFAKEVIDDEISRINTQQPYHCDYGVVDDYIYRTVGESDLGAILKLLYWRGRQQSAIWDVFEALVHRGYITAESLQRPITLAKNPQATSHLAWLIGCFEGPVEKAAQDNPPFPLYCEFEEPVAWLATIIIRSCADIQNLMETIEHSEFLGVRNEEAFQEYMKWCEPKHFTCNPAERATDNPAEPSVFGLWLPHGVLAQTQHEFTSKVRTHIRRFNRIERAYKAYFNLSDEQLLCEDQQEGYYVQNPRKLPGYFDDGT